MGDTGVFELDGSFVTGISVDAAPLPYLAQVNLNVPVELTDNSTSFLTFAGICAKLDDINPSTANLVLT